MIQYFFVGLELNIFQKKLKSYRKKVHRKQKYHKNIYRIQAYDLIICEYFCIGFIDFMLKSKSLLDYTNLFSHNCYEKN